MSWGLLFSKHLSTTSPPPLKSPTFLLLVSFLLSLCSPDSTLFFLVCPKVYSADLLECMAQPFWKDLVNREIEWIEPHFIQIFNHKSLAKELTEAWTSYKKVKQIVERINVPASDIILFDMCSGKGFNTLIISKMFPHFKKVYAIDKDKKMNTQHFQALHNVTYKLADVNQKSFHKWVADEVQHAKGIFLGVHLCGELSQNFISLYNKTENLIAMILSPCCKPSSLFSPSLLQGPDFKTVIYIY